MGNSERIKELIDWKLFMAMFRLCVKSLNENREKVKEGTLHNIAEKLDADVDIKTKNRFLQELVLKGVLIPSRNISWGGKDCVVYRIDADKLYELFKSTQMGKEAKDVFGTFVAMFE